MQSDRGVTWSRKNLIFGGVDFLPVNRYPYRFFSHHAFNDLKPIIVENVTILPGTDNSFR
jgi:hypothetical protein